jgi:DNA-binding CsgD family transcriptional regulator
MTLNDALYGAATDISRWGEVVDAITEHVSRGPTSMLRRTGRPLDTQSVLATNLDPTLARSYRQYFGSINPWALQTRSERPPIQINDGWISAPDLKRSEFYADWLRPQGMRYCLNICVRLARDETIEFGAVRPRSLGPFDDTQIRLVDSLLPHIARAVEISRRLSLAAAIQDTSLQTVRRLGAGTLMVDSQGRVVFLDQAAEHIVTSVDGVRVRNGRLEASQPNENSVKAAIARATGYGKTATGRTGTLLTISGPEPYSTLSVAIVPVDERDRSDGLVGPLATVLLYAPERNQTPTSAGLQRLFDFTPAEAKLVAALCAGETLSTYAKRSGASLNTIKTHLKHVFEKTGETRQVDLVRRVAADVAVRFVSSDVR